MKDVAQVAQAEINFRGRREARRKALRVEIPVATQAGIPNRAQGAEIVGRGIPNGGARETKNREPDVAQTVFREEISFRHRGLGRKELRHKCRMKIPVAVQAEIPNRVHETENPE